jgi:hypothetical protein
MHKIARTTIQNSVTQDVHTPVRNADFTQITFMTLCRSYHQCVMKLLKKGLIFKSNCMIMAINGVSSKH